MHKVNLQDLEAVDFGDKILVSFERGEKKVVYTNERQIEVSEDGDFVADFEGESLELDAVMYQMPNGSFQVTFYYFILIISLNSFLN